MMVWNTSQLRRFKMPQGEPIYITERDRLRVEAFRQTPEGKRFHQEVHDRAMRNVEFRIAKGLYTPTEKDLQELEEWRKEKAQLENTSVE